MYAIVEILGKQYKAAEGSVLTIDLIDAEPGKKVEFDSVLMVNNNDKIAFGGPYLAGAKVTATVEKHTKGDKVVVFKYRPTKDSKRKTGHRQKYSVIKVTSITA
jgi:large subunit ribosomal protein L21